MSGLCGSNHTNVVFSAGTDRYILTLQLQHYKATHASTYDSYITGPPVQMFNVAVMVVSYLRLPLGALLFCYLEIVSPRHTSLILTP